MRFCFNITLFTKENGFDTFSTIIYAHNQRSAFNKLFKELGELKSFLFSISLDVCKSEIFHSYEFKRM